MGVSLIKPWSSSDLDMELLENTMDARRILDASLIDSLVIILVIHEGITRPNETEI